MNTRTTRSLMVAAITALSAHAHGAAPKIQNEINLNRSKLSGMEGKARPADLFASLTDLTHPGTLDDANIEGKVVVVALVSTLDPSSIMAMSALDRIDRNYRQSGVVVVAVHPEIGYEQITEKVMSGDITYPVAKDAGGAMARTLFADDYPDLYVIDRAGQMRYLDIKSRSLKAAVEQLAGETPERAVENAKIEARGGSIAPSAQETGPGGAQEGGADAGDAADTGAPGQAQPFADVDWPEPNTKKVYADRDIQGQRLPSPIGARETWLGDPQELEGKVIVVSFWGTDCASCRPLFSSMRKLQEENPDSLVVIGLSGGEPLEDVEQFIERYNPDFPQMYDEQNHLVNAIGVRPPHVLVLSSDGVVRWQGLPTRSKIAKVVNAIIEADPAAGG